MHKKGYVWIGFLCALVLGLDIGLKRYVVENISLMKSIFQTYPYGGVAVFQDWHGIDFSLNYVMNKGAAWGIFSEIQSYLPWGRCVIIAALVMYLVLARLSMGQRGALLLILVGALGNVLDFFMYGHVVDMLHFCFWGYSFAVFNIADSAIFCGVLLFFIQNYEKKPKSFEPLKNK